MVPTSELDRLRLGCSRENAGGALMIIRRVRAGRELRGERNRHHNA